MAQLHFGVEVHSKEGAGMKTSAILCGVALLAAAVPPGAPAASISVGAFIPPGNQEIKSYLADIQDFNRGTGKNHAIILHYRGFDFSDASLLRSCRDAGAVPFVNCVSHVDDSWTYERIINGSHDSDIRAMARSFRDFGDRILLCVDSEMNISPNSSTSFKQMWQHVHAVFAAEGATNIEWVWSPNHHATTGALNYSEYYPGDNYVHWVGTEGFCGRNESNSAAALFGPILSAFSTSYPNKPAIISYMGGDQTTTQKKSQWITDAYTSLKGYGNLKAIIWWNDSVGSDDYRVYPTSYKPTSVPADVTTAYKNAVASSSYLSTLPAYADLGGGGGGGGGGATGLTFTLSPSSVARGNSFSLNWTISGINQSVDGYLAVVLPDNSLLVADSKLNWTTEITPCAKKFNPGGSLAGPLPLGVPSDVAPGIYTFETVLVPAGASATDSRNWLGSGLYSSPLTVQ